MDGFSKDECVVCGVKTEQCCSCKLPFCSPEHQKLLWRTHKRICKKKEFQRPPITLAELNWALDREDDPEAAALRDMNGRERSRVPSLVGAHNLDVVLSQPKWWPLVRDIPSYSSFPYNRTLPDLGPFAQVCYAQRLADKYPPETQATWQHILIQLLHFSTLLYAFQAQSGREDPDALTTVKTHHLGRAVEQLKIWTDKLKGGLSDELEKTRQMPYKMTKDWLSKVLVAILAKREQEGMGRVWDIRVTM